LGDRPSLPFLVEWALQVVSFNDPPTTETRTFLHDIPFLRRAALDRDATGTIAILLG